ncbi:hypothetical protein LEWO105114_12125 [Legionella worsleiensis]|nr:Uncharacterised protein [Legionella worsleiensis]
MKRYYTNGNVIFTLTNSHTLEKVTLIVDKLDRVHLGDNLKIENPLHV